MKKILLGLALLLGIKSATAQYSSMNVAGLLVPKYAVAGDSNNTRLPSYMRLRLQNLSPNAEYRYIIKLIGSNEFSSKSLTVGAGGAIYVDTAGGNFRVSTSSSFSSGNHDTLKTDFMGAYEGWFGYYCTSNTRFQAGSKIYLAVIAMGLTTGDTLRMYCEDSMEVLTSTRGSSTRGQAIWGKSMAKGKSFVALYDNTVGSGRPQYISAIEGWSYTGAALSQLAGYYFSNAYKKSGNWAAIVPNGLTSGIQRIDNLSAATGMSIYANKDSDGIWGPSGKNTVKLTDGYWNPIALDNDDAALVPPSIEFWSRSSTTTESVGTYKIYAKRMYANEDSSFARFFVSGGTALEGASKDFTATERLVKFAGSKGVQYDTISININDDNISEGPEIIVVGLDKPNNAAIGVERAHSITVNDNDIANISISSSPIVVKENSGKVGITLKMDKAVNTSSKLKLTVIKQGDSTYIPSEFELGSTGKDSVVNLGKSGSTDSITIFAKVNDDFVADQNDTVVVRVRQIEGNAFLADSLITIVMTDNDGPSRVAFAGPRAITVNEKDGSFDVKIAVISRTDATADFSLRCYTARSTATEGVDFKFNPTSKIINIDSKTPDTIVVNVPVINDDLFELNKTIYFGLGGLSNTLVNNKDTLVVSLINDDLPIYKINTINKQNASTGVADSLNIRCRVYGTVYGVNMRVTGFNFTIMDNTGGIGVYNSPKVFGYSVKEGDSIMVQGRVGQFQGLVQMDQLDTVMVIATSRKLKSPTLVTALGESTESSLVTMRRVKLVDAAEWPSTALNANGFKNVRIVGTTGRIDTLNIDAETDIDGNTAPEGYFDVIGIGGQFDNSNPFTSRYVLSPRRFSDFNASTLPVVTFTETLDSVFEAADSFRMDFKIAPADDNFSFDVVVKSATAVSPDDYDFATRKINIIKNTSSVMIRANISDDNVYDGDKFVEFAIRNIQGPGKIGADSVLVLKIKDNEANNVKRFALGGIKMYPNPTNGMFTIQSTTEMAEVKVTNMVGAVISTNSVNSKQYKSSISGAAGLYMIQVKLKDGSMYTDRIQLL
jgi:hypothetical protein